MLKRGWWKFGAIAAVAIGVVSLLPGSIASVAWEAGATPAVTVSTTLTPHWNTGNLCQAEFNDPAKGDVQCVSTIWNSPVPLTYNFSAGAIENGVENITIKGSNDCIYLNFHSFDTTINIKVLGSGYGCPTGSPGSGGSTWALPSTSGAAATVNEGQNGCKGGNGNSISEWSSGGGEHGCCSYGSWSSYGGVWGPAQWSSGGQKQNECGPGINIVINSEGDTLNLVQGSHPSPCGENSYADFVTGVGYATNVTIYGTTTFVNATMYQDNLNTTITYIGIQPGFKVCPSGITVGRVSWAVTAYGNHDTFNTIFVDGTNIKHVPPNQGYTTQPLGPPNGVAKGFGDVYGSETTTVVPPGTCGYVTP